MGMPDTELSRLRGDPNLLLNYDKIPPTNESSPLSSLPNPNEPFTPTTVAQIGAGPLPNDIPGWNGFAPNWQPTITLSSPVAAGAYDVATTSLANGTPYTPAQDDPALSDDPGQALILSFLGAYVSDPGSSDGLLSEVRPEANGENENLVYKELYALVNDGPLDRMTASGLAQVIGTYQKEYSEGGIALTAQETANIMNAINAVRADPNLEMIGVLEAGGIPVDRS